MWVVDEIVAFLVGSVVFCAKDEIFSFSSELGSLTF
jgi:hypothetical protein